MFANRLVSLFVSDVFYDHYSALDKKGKKCENGAQWVWNGLTDHILIHIKLLGFDHSVSSREWPKSNIIGHFIAF